MNNHNMDPLMISLIIWEFQGYDLPPTQSGGSYEGQLWSWF